MVQNIEKCFDKNAKVHFKIKMLKVSDIIADRKSRKDKGKDKDKDKKKNGDKSDMSKSNSDNRE